jgi:hypothetical protein
VFVSDVASGCPARAAHGHQAQQRDGAAESYSEHGEDEENAWTQGLKMLVLIVLNHSSSIFLRKYHGRVVVVDLWLSSLLSL